MNSRERVINVFKQKEVDRVPTFEWLIDKKVINSICPGLTYEEFICKMDLDALVIEIDYETMEIEDNLYKDEWGIIKKDTGEAYRIPVSGPIKTMHDFKKYRPPDPFKKNRYKTLDYMLSKYKNKK